MVVWGGRGGAQRRGSTLGRARPRFTPKIAGSANTHPCPVTPIHAPCHPSMPRANLLGVGRHHGPQPRRRRAFGQLVQAHRARQRLPRRQTSEPDLHQLLDVQTPVPVACRGGGAGQHDAGGVRGVPHARAVHPARHLLQGAGAGGTVRVAWVSWRVVQAGRGGSGACRSWAPHPTLSARPFPRRPVSRPPLTPPPPPPPRTRRRAGTAEMKPTRRLLWRYGEEVGVGVGLAGL